MNTLNWGCDMYCIIIPHEGYIEFNGEDGRTGSEPLFGLSMQQGIIRMKEILKTLGFDEFEIIEGD